MKAASSRPKPVDGAGDQPVHDGLVRHVGGDGGGAARGGGDLGGDGVELRWAPAGQDDRCAFAGELQRSGAADAASSAGDERHLAVQTLQAGGRGFGEGGHGRLHLVWRPQIEGGDRIDNPL